MKKETITISVEAEKLRAARWHMVKRDAVLETELSNYFQRLYEKYVPSSVREYIDESDVAEAPGAASAKKNKDYSAQ